MTPFRRAGRPPGVPRRPINIEPTLKEKIAAEQARYLTVKNCAQVIRDYAGAHRHYLYQLDGLMMDIADTHYSRLRRVTKGSK